MATAVHEAEQRDEIALLLDELPRLARVLDAHLARAWLPARRSTRHETGLAAEIFPLGFPFAGEAALALAWLPD